jgi:cytochrome c-type biogenesis protein CcmE
MGTPASRITDGAMRDALRITALALAGLIAFAYVTRDREDTRYLMVDELGDLAALEGKSLKVHGWVLPGSIEHAVVDGRTVWSFVVQRNNCRLSVVYTGTLPDTFRDQAEVVLPGTLVAIDDSYVLEASEVLAKCATRYSENPKVLRYE